MIFKREITRRMIHTPVGAGALQSNQLLEAFTSAFDRKRYYSGYYRPEDVRAHLILECGMVDKYANCPTPLVAFTVSNFDPSDMTVEVNIPDRAVADVEEFFGKPIGEIDLFNVWLTEVEEDKVIAIELSAFQLTTKEMSDEIKNKSAP